MNIQEYLLKIKLFLEGALGEWGLLALVLLVGIMSFGLGRFSAFEDVKPPVSITLAGGEAKPQSMYMGGLYVASRTGSVYYYPWCSGASNIAPQNQRWFKSPQEAQNAGYKPSKACKGL
jgi:hypothetical protein